MLIKDSIDDVRLHDNQHEIKLTTQDEQSVNNETQMPRSIGGVFFTGNNPELFEQNDSSFKKIPVTLLSKELQAQLIQSINLLTLLNNEVEEKKVSTIHKKILIDEKLHELKDLKNVSLNQDQFQRSEESIYFFLALLEKMEEEINHDITFYNTLISDAPPQFVYGNKEDTSDFAKLVEQSIIFIKKHVKAVNRDLAISFSRYHFGFDVQLRQIMHVESILKKIGDHDNSHELTVDK